MANIRQIRRRIRSVQSTAKITKAMQMIAASKMRRAQQLTLAGRPYAEKLQGVLADLAAQPVEVGDVHPLLQKREISHTSVVHITPDRGLCGGLNSNMNRTTGQFIVEQQDPVSVIAVGRKGRDFMVRYGREVRAVFIDLGDRPGLAEALPIAYQIIDELYERPDRPGHDRLLTIREHGGTEAGDAAAAADGACVAGGWAGRGVYLRAAEHRGARGAAAPLC